MCGGSWEVAAKTGTIEFTGRDVLKSARTSLYEAAAAYGLLSAWSRESVRETDSATFEFTNDAPGANPDQTFAAIFDALSTIDGNPDTVKRQIVSDQKYLLESAGIMSSVDWEALEETNNAELATIDAFLAAVGVKQLAAAGELVNA